MIVLKRSMKPASSHRGNEFQLPQTMMVFGDARCKSTLGRSRLSMAPATAVTIGACILRKRRFGGVMLFGAADGRRHTSGARPASVRTRLGEAEFNPCGARKRRAARDYGLGILRPWRPFLILRVAGHAQEIGQAQSARSSRCGWRSRETRPGSRKPDPPIDSLYHALIMNLISTAISPRAGPSRSSNRGFQLGTASRSGPRLPAKPFRLASTGALRAA